MSLFKTQSDSFFNDQDFCTQDGRYSYRFEYIHYYNNKTII